MGDFPRSQSSDCEPGKYHILSSSKSRHFTRTCLTVSLSAQRENSCWRSPDRRMPTLGWYHSSDISSPEGNTSALICFPFSVMGLFFMIEFVTKIQGYYHLFIQWENGPNDGNIFPLVHIFSFRDEHFKTRFVFLKSGDLFFSITTYFKKWRG